MTFLGRLCRAQATAYEQRAIELARLSPCLRLKVGAVLVRFGRIVGEGCNAPVIGKPCETCRRIERGIEPGTRYEECRSLHAEQAAVIDAGREADGAILYLATLDPATGIPANRRPCPICARVLLGAGVNPLVRLVDAPLVDLIECYPGAI
jgi:dCMP deaminase